SSSSWPGRTLMATVRLRTGSVARYTTPMPPTPSRSTISYRPIRDGRGLLKVAKQVRSVPPYYRRVELADSVAPRCRPGRDQSRPRLFLWNHELIFDAERLRHLTRPDPAI